MTLNGLMSICSLALVSSTLIALEHGRGLAHPVENRLPGVIKVASQGTDAPTLPCGFLFRNDIYYPRRNYIGVSRYAVVDPALS